MKSKYKPYPKYKESGVEWLGEIPEGWIATKVKHKAPYQVGWTPPTKNSENFDGENKWVTIGDLKGKFISTTKNCISNKAVEEASMDLTPKGSLLFSFKLSVGTVAFAGEDLYTNEAIASFLKNDRSDIAYLYYATPFFIVQNASENIYGAKILNQELISNATLALPPLQEQKAIATYLDRATQKIDALIAKQEHLIALLKEKRQALISHAVTKGVDDNGELRMENGEFKDSGVEWLGKIPAGWEVSKLRFIFYFSKGLTITKANLKDEGIPCVNYGEIHSKYGFEVSTDKHELKCVDKSYLSGNISSLLSKGDFVFADTSEDIEGAGNFTHVSSESQIFAGYHTIVARDFSGSNFRFLAYLMDSENFRTQIRLSVKGVKVFSITQFILKDSIVWLPPIEEQKAIATYLDQKTQAIDTLIDKATKSITLLKEKRTALISAVVTGKVDVRDEV